MSWCVENITHDANNARISRPARPELDRQVEALFKKCVAAAFAVLECHYPERTLIMEGGGVVPESAESRAIVIARSANERAPMSGAALGAM